MSDLLQGLTLGLHLATAHLSAGLEPITPGIYVRTEAGLTVGAYRNSYGHLSEYAGWTWQGDTFALTTGLVAGYRGPSVKTGEICAEQTCRFTFTEHRRIVPLFVPSARFNLGEVTGRISILPSPAAVHFSIEHTF